MNKEEIEGKAVEYALGTMPEGEIGEFEAELREDRLLQSLVHEWQEMNELDASESPGVDVPFHVFSGIVDEIEKDREAGPTAEAAVSEGRVVSFWQWSGWAVAACAALAFAVFGLRGGVETSERESIVAGIVLKEMGKPGSQRLQDLDEKGGRQARMIELAELAEAYWDSRESTAEGDSTGGFTVFDPEFEIGFIAVENLPDREEGKSFHVWARSEGSEQPVRAGSLPVGKSSFGMFYFDISAKEGIDSRDENLSFFVTEESTTDPVKPSGTVVLSGI